VPTVAFDHAKHAELLELLLSADREESEALDALSAFVAKRANDPEQFAALTERARAAAEVRNGITKALNDLLEAY
jgi:hypothetical protein